MIQVLALLDLGAGRGTYFFLWDSSDMILLSCFLDMCLAFLNTLASLRSIWSVSLSLCQLFDSHKEGVLLYQIASTVSQDIVVTFQLCQSFNNIVNMSTLSILTTLSDCQHVNIVNIVSILWRPCVNIVY